MRTSSSPMATRWTPAIVSALPHTGARSESCDDEGRDAHRKGGAEIRSIRRPGRDARAVSRLRLERDATWPRVHLVAESAHDRLHDAVVTPSHVPLVGTGARADLQRRLPPELRDDRARRRRTGGAGPREIG